MNVKPTVFVVIENPNSEDWRVKAVFETKETAQDAIEQEFPNSNEYEIVTRSLLRDITD